MQNAHEGDICLTREKAADFEYKNTKTNTNTNTNIKYKYKPTQILIKKNGRKPKMHRMHKKMIFAGGREKKRVCTVNVCEIEFKIEEKRPIWG